MLAVGHQEAGVGRGWGEVGGEREGRVHHWTCPTAGWPLDFTLAGLVPLSLTAVLASLTWSPTWLICFKFKI